MLSSSFARFSWPGRMASHQRLAVLMLLPVAVLVTSWASPALGLPGPGTFTTVADFEQGTLKGVVAEEPGQLKLGLVSGTEPYIWIANNTLGRVTKIDTRTGAIVGQYYSTARTVLPDNLTGQTAIPGQGGSDQSPSRTAVDLDGNVFVANRANVSGTNQSSLTKIAGSAAYAVDRNQNGSIETSSGLNNLLPDDECVIWTAKVGLPGQIARGIAVDAQNNVWVGTYYDAKIYRFNGQTGELMQVIDLKAETGISDIQIYGMAIGRNQCVYTTSHDSRWAVITDPQAPAGQRSRAVKLAYIGYGIAVDAEGRQYIGRWEGGPDTASVQVVDWSGSFAQVSYRWGPGGGRTRGVAVDADRNVWVANYDRSTLIRFDASGAFVAEYPVAGGPIGVAVDNDGKIWAIGSQCTRIDPVTQARDDFPTGGEAYSYSDMTGFQLRNFTSRQGTWSITLDGGSYGAKWQTLNWNGQQPAGSLLRVEARAAEAVGSLGSRQWVEAQAGQPLSSVKGRYLEVRAILRIISGVDGPVLSDLTVAPPIAGETPVVVNIPQAKQVPAGTVVRLNSKPVTFLDGSTIYIEEPSRSAGIGAVIIGQAQPGDSVTLLATTALEGGELKLVDAIVESVEPSTPVEPVWMTLYTLGGGPFGQQPGITGAAGTNNVGLLVRVSGTVTYAGDGFYYLDDGSNTDDGSGHPGVRVRSAKAVSPGSTVTLTGISHCTLDGTSIRRQIRPISLTYSRYANGFEQSAGSEWTTPALTVSPSGRGFLGILGPGTNALTLSAVEPHSRVRVSFDLFILLSWDTEVWKLTVPGIADPLLNATFGGYHGTTQSYPDPVGGGPYERGTGASEAGTLGYNWGSDPMNWVYSFAGAKSFEFDHSDTSLTINFTSNEDQAWSDEGWGLDNVTVELLP